MTVQEQLILLSTGVDPSTGEVLDLDKLCNNPAVANAIVRLTHKAFPFAKNLPKLIPCNSLNRPVNSMFEKLRSWRINEAAIINLPAYCVFSDEELRNICMCDVCCKEDLLLVKGISQKRYDLYADAIMDIISEYF